MLAQARSFTRSALVPLLAASPRVAFGAAGLTGRCRRILGSTALTPTALAALLGDQPAPALRALARDIETRAVQNHLLELLVDARGPRVLAPHVRTHGFERLHALRAAGRPVLLVTWHAGPYPAVGAALLAVGVDFLALRHRVRGPACAGMQTVATGEGSWSAVTALKHAIERLRAGGLVLMAGDGLRGERASTTEVSVLGRRVGFHHGLAALARHSGAPVLPVVARWRGGSIEVHLHEPLAPSATDRDGVLHAAARWLDGYLRSAPEELRPDRIRLLLAAPRIEATEVAA
jgi:KDO2-lipid IV(A) lauroyltransferase